MGGNSAPFKKTAGKGLGTDMSRVMIFDALLFLSPFILFALWRMMFHGARGHREIYDDAPFLALFLVGVILGTGGLYFIASSHKPEKPQAIYVPPRLENGKIRPGHFEEKDEKTGMR